MYRNYRIENLLNRYEEAGIYSAGFEFLRNGYNFTRNNNYPILVFEDFDNITDFIELYDVLEEAEIDEFLLLDDSPYTEYLENAGWYIIDECTIETPDIKVSGKLIY